MSALKKNLIEKINIIIKNDLYNDYSKYSDMSLDDYCKKHELSDNDKKILYLMDEVNRLKEEKEKELIRILNNERKSGRNK